MICCHDGAGLGHTWRGLQIASHVAESLVDSSTLILSDLQAISRLRFPQNVDYVHLPGIVRGSQQDYEARSLNLDLQNVLRIRRRIILSVAKNFKPDVIIFEGDPHILSPEMTRILASLKDKVLQTRIVWALPDILGESRAVRRQWAQGNVYEMLNQYCDEIWIYGSRGVFDLIREYEVPRTIADRLCYTGYLQPPAVSSNLEQKHLAPMDSSLPLVLVTAGSGVNGFNLINNYLTFLERNNGHTAIQSMVFTGPMMSSGEKRALLARAQKLSKVTFRRFSKHFLAYMRNADLVVGTGGYNTMCEILSFGKKAILVPPPEHLNEHRLRAEVFHNLGLVELLRPEALNANHLEEKIRSALATPSPTSDRDYPHMLSMDGLENVIDRIKALTSAEQCSLSSGI